MAEPAEGDREKVVRNERAKRTATFLNGVAVSVFIVGGVSPSLTYVVSSGATRPSIPAVALAGVGCLLASAGLHFMARGSIESLTP